MEQDLTEEQRMIANQAARILERSEARATTRRVLDGTGEFDRPLWRQAVDSGWPAVAVPEAHGGLGLGPVETCLIAEQLGSAPASVPFLASSVLATQVLMLCDDPAARGHWLPRLAAGDALGSLSLSGTPAAENSPIPRLHDSRLDGESTPVLGGLFANFVILMAQSDGGCRLVLCELPGAGVQRTALDTIDNGQGYARLSFVGSPARTLLGAAAPILDSVLDYAAIVAAFSAIGGADACLAMARDYALTRKAFGQPIGSFQAVKHTLADAYALIEVARGNARYALWQWSTGQTDLRLGAGAARLSAIKAYEFVAKENIQLHGGFGVTWAADCHLHYRRSRTLALDLGSAPYWSERLVRALTS
jgi:acyl-CoA dehydrogenase